MIPVEGRQAKANQAHNLHLLLLLLPGSPPVSIGRCLEESHQRRLEPTIRKVVESTCMNAVSVVIQPSLTIASIVLASGW
jgi:hypothetical protein